ncbi:MAG TPA: CPBP family intramembrane glutamic endopeptidase [Opitutaceae bacterium]|nr:CPBP family intramembrane glutamic endopeptidase [Opitutaceae bacterium]
MSENPLLLVVMIVVSAALFHLWWSDLRAARAGRPNPRAFPGAVPCERRLLVIAVLGSAALLAIEILGENALGLTAQQKTVTVLWSLYTFAASFTEELAFRGFLVVTNRGRAALWGSIVGFSVVFALAHPFLWSWTDGKLEFTFTIKAWFSTAMIFVGSLWFYALRFAAFNPARSLLPCIVAHLTKNLGVFAAKAAAGFIAGWY